MFVNVGCGVVAGTVSSAIANPTDVLKVRMQAACTSMQRKTLIECFREVYRYEGLTGLWRVSDPICKNPACSFSNQFQQF